NEDDYKFISGLAMNYLIWTVNRYRRRTKLS
ncbi:unnamed protein product, partial [marine sediment metagenome]